MVPINVIKKSRIADTYTSWKLIASHIALNPPWDLLNIPIKNGKGINEKMMNIDKKCENISGHMVNSDPNVYLLSIKLCLKSFEIARSSSHDPFIIINS